VPRALHMGRSSRRTKTPLSPVKGIISISRIVPYAGWTTQRGKVSTCVSGLVSVAVTD
jgi:hypothetical protein